MRVLALTMVACLWATSAAAQDTVAITDPLSGQVITVPALTPADVRGHDRATHAAVAVVVACHFLDLATSMYAIGKGIAEEKNPALKPFEHNPIRFAAVKYSIAVGSVWTVYKAHAKHPTLAKWLAYSDAVTTCGVAFANQRLLESTR